MRGHGRLSCLHITRPTLLSSGLAHFCRNSWGSLIPKPTMVFLSTVNNLCAESRSLSGGSPVALTERNTAEQERLEHGHLGKRSRTGRPSCLKDTIQSLAQSNAPLSVWGHLSWGCPGSHPPFPRGCFTWLTHFLGQWLLALKEVLDGCDNKETPWC